MVNRSWLRGQVRKGKSDAEIGSSLRISVTAVGYWRRKFGIKPRPASQRIKQAIKKKWPNGRFGADAANWHGGRMHTGSGYVRIYMPKHPDANHAGYIYEHRYVMEQKIGRRLKKGEIVDHIDRNRSNNAPENLRLHASRAKHVHDHFAARDQLTALVVKLRALPVEIFLLEVQDYPSTDMKHLHVRAVRVESIYKILAEAVAP